jgi:hypothetical protein
MSDETHASKIPGGAGRVNAKGGGLSEPEIQVAVDAGPGHFEKTLFLDDFQR